MWNQEKEHQLGALIGSLVGDAAGATLEFSRKVISDTDAEHAMSMPGGGSLNVAPGQITDDGELTLALVSVLRKHHPLKKYPLKDVASAYVAWFMSEPFDSGFTCRRAFDTLRHAPSINMALSEIAEYNAMSEANGALMRVSPIGAFYHELPYSVIGAYAKMDAKLSHPSQVCQDANALYSVAIADCINFQRDHEGVILTIEDYVARNSIHPTVMCWLEESIAPLHTIDCSQNIGHVKHGFTLAFHFLRRGVPFAEAIRETLKKRGDTDTNACIVGGLMGALHGFNGIPEDMREIVLDFDCVKHDPWKSLQGHNRPATYNSLNAYDFIMSLR